MDTKFVKFKKAGRWARDNVAAPQYSVEKDEVKELDEASAKMVVDAKAGAYVDPPEPPPEEEISEDETSGEETPEGETSEGEGKGVKGLLQRRGRRRSADPLG